MINICISKAYHLVVKHLEIDQTISVIPSGDWSTGLNLIRICCVLSAVRLHVSEIIYQSLERCLPCFGRINVYQPSTSTNLEIDWKNIDISYWVRVQIENKYPYQLFRKCFQALRLALRTPAPFPRHRY